MERWWDGTAWTDNPDMPQVADSSCAGHLVRRRVRTAQGPGGHVQSPAFTPVRGGPLDPR
ncbi:DUF2510 domain-containing protein [Streptomyces canus]|uniref:DUF2510 domain-containing protein n=1 Tax=Streptomyces canus TaxID=58343 RepID=UPI0027D861DC|nr:DUF2510 domain-containing protein [Streptomyces canus]